MKKYILLVAVCSTFIMCKKGESATSQLENSVSGADSTLTNAVEKVNTIQENSEAAFDSASIKIKDFEKSKNDITEKIESTSKSIDSISDKIANMKLESKVEKKDSSANKKERIVVNLPAPRIIKETKIVYKDKPKNSEALTVSKNKMQKSGILELNVNNAETAKEIVKEQVKKYDGFIRSENISLNNNDKKIAYLKVKIPIQKFDYLMDDLSYNIGEVENKGVEVTGQDFVNNTLCDVEITLYGTDTNFTAKEDHPKGFGEKSLAAISSGWDVITSIFLFFLPLWPLCLIGGIIYLFYKRKKNNITNNDSN